MNEMSQFETVISAQIMKACDEFRMISDDQTLLAGVIGYPLTQTLSPLMHNAALNSINLINPDVLNAIYLRLPIEPDQFKQAMLILKRRFIGFNVTIPFKETILPYLDSVSDDAIQIGAVNTVKVVENQLLGFNTDADGFAWSISKENGIPIKDKIALVFGAGGAARAIVYALLREGASRVIIVNRDLDRANQLKLHFMGDYSSQIETLSLSSPEVAYYMPYADLIINSSSVGMTDTDPLLYHDTEWIKPQKHIFFDAIYQRPTPFLTMARKIGAKTIDGAGMLYGQGAIAFHIIFDEHPPRDIMRRALIEHQRSASKESPPESHEQSSDSTIIDSPV